MVFAFHSWEFGDSPALRLGPIHLGQYIGRFYSGVDLFMVISGFCLMWPLVSKPKILSSWSWRDFAARRIRRIVPPYYAAIALLTILPTFLVILFHVMGKPAKWQELPTPWQFFTHLLFIQTFFLNTWASIEGSLWSLGLEAQFYLVFPLVVLAYRRWGIRTVVWLSAVSVAYRMIVGYLTRDMEWTIGFLFGITFIGRWMQFAAGMWAAWVVARRTHSGRPFSSLFGAGMLAGFVLVYIAANSEFSNNLRVFPLRDLLLGIGFSWLTIAACASTAPGCRLLQNRALTKLGIMSYSMYLLHQNVIYYFGEMLKRVGHLSGTGRFVVLMTIGFAIVLAVCYPFFKLIEEPFTRAPRPSRRDQELPAPELSLTREPSALQLPARVPTEQGQSQPMVGDRVMSAAV
jgi:peptidoglycan/LPS O-acetylase OafA/YrhL